MFLLRAVSADYALASPPLGELRKLICEALNLQQVGLRGQWYRRVILTGNPVCCNHSYDVLMFVYMCGKYKEKGRKGKGEHIMDKKRRKSVHAVEAARYTRHTTNPGERWAQTQSRRKTIKRTKLPGLVLCCAKLECMGVEKNADPENVVLTKL